MLATTRSEIRELSRRMRRVARQHRALNPLSPPVWEAGGYPLATRGFGRPDTNALVWFPSPGCFWSLKGGCTMCNFGANPDVGSMEDALGAFQVLLGQLNLGTRRIHIANGGSYFSDLEVSPDMRREVLRSLIRFPFLRSVGVETRPNLVTFQRLMDAVNALPSGVEELLLGFGFECLDDLVREVTVNKGFGPAQIENAVRIIHRVNSSQNRVHVNFEVYVLLKPLFMSEQEAIDEAVRTIDWSCAQGAKDVVLFLNTVKEHTIQDYLASRSDLDPPIRFQPPYYRTAIETLRVLSPESRRRARVLGVQSGVIANGLPRACPLCEAFLLGALMAFNFTGDDRILDEAANSYCPCRDTWKRELIQPAPPLASRIQQGLEILEQAFPN